MESVGLYYQQFMFPYYTKYHANWFKENFKAYQYMMKNLKRSGV